MRFLRWRLARPLAIDLFTGLHGWSAGLVAAGWRVVGFDIEDMCGQFGAQRPEHVQLVLQDVLTVDGSQFRDAQLIVASPPCQEFGYMAMPWSRAKQIARALRGEDEFPDGYRGSRTVAELTALFDACFRIQREASAAAGRHIPLIVENVKGAQPWVGKARWNYGSFYLWGDVPALMPMAVGAQKWNPDGTARPPGSWFAISDSVNRGQKVPGFRFDGSGRSFQSASVEHSGVKAPGMNWSDQTRRGQDFTRLAGNHAMDGIKQRGSGREWFAGEGKISRMTSSKSQARKAASAMIAKIPPPLARHIARTYMPPQDAQ